MLVNSIKKIVLKIIKNYNRLRFYTNCRRWSSETQETEPSNASGARSSVRQELFPGLVASQYRTSTKLYNYSDVSPRPHDVPMALSLWSSFCFIILSPSVKLFPLPPPLPPDTPSARFSWLYRSRVVCSYLARSRYLPSYYRMVRMQIRVAFCLWSYDIGDAFIRICLGLHRYLSSPLVYFPNGFFSPVLKKLTDNAGIAVVLTIEK